MLRQTTIARSQCWRKPKWSTPNYNNCPSIFWRPFLVVTFQNNNRLTSAWAHLRSFFYTLILPLRQPIRPFTTNKALPGPPLHRDGSLFPVPPGRGVRWWSERSPIVSCHFNRGRAWDKFASGESEHVLTDTMLKVHVRGPIYLCRPLHFELLYLYGALSLLCGPFTPM